MLMLGAKWETRSRTLFIKTVLCVQLCAGAGTALACNIVDGSCYYDSDCCSGNNCVNGLCKISTGFRTWMLGGSSEQAYYEPWSLIFYRDNIPAPSGLVANAGVQRFRFPLFRNPREPLANVK